MCFCAQDPFGVHRQPSAPPHGAGDDRKQDPNTVMDLVRLKGGTMCTSLCAAVARRSGFRSSIGKFSPRVPLHVPPTTRCKMRMMDNVRRSLACVVIPRILVIFRVRMNLWMTFTTCPKLLLSNDKRNALRHHHHHKQRAQLPVRKSLEFLRDKTPAWLRSRKRNHFWVRPRKITSVESIPHMREYPKPFSWLVPGLLLASGSTFEVGEEALRSGILTPDDVSGKK